MNITDILAQVGGFESIARELGLSESQAQHGAEALAPAVLGGIKKHAQSQSTGLEELGSLLEQLGGGGLLDDVLSTQPTNVRRGNDVLGQIFGSKDVSRAVAQNASSQSGLDLALLKKMLPMLAMLVTGFMAKQHNAGAVEMRHTSSGGLNELLGGLFGGQSALTGGEETGAMPGLASMLDLNHDGNPLDDILEKIGKTGC